MNLLIDAGNTLIKWAVVNAPGGITPGSHWQSSGVLPVAQAAELSRELAGFGGFRHIWASNVAGEDVAQRIRVLPAETCHFVQAQAEQCGVRNGYANAVQLGSDRWMALIAAWRLLGQSCLVVNSGTATTVDALSGAGEFLGGLILPGVALMQRCLATATAQLPEVSGNYANFPRNTADALFSGAVQASCGAIERQHALLGDSAAPIVLSGGAAGLLQEYLGRLNLPVCLVDNLVLQGLMAIAQETDAR